MPNSPDKEESQESIASASTIDFESIKGYGRRDESIIFEKTTATTTTTGNFHHIPKRRQYFYEEYLKRPDRFFHLDVGTECDSFYKGKSVQYKDKVYEIFYHVVDLDSFEYHKIVFHTFLSTVLQHVIFRGAILALVLLSALMIGLSTFPFFQGNVQHWFRVMDQVILSVFIVEIVIKWMYDFRLFWKVAWNLLDFLIVAIVVLTAVFPFTENTDHESGGGNIIIMIRVIRAFRSLKSISSLSSLHIVTKTVIKSAVDMANILLVLIIFMLVMAVMGVTIFDNVESPWFLNTVNAWFLMFICMTQDGWNGELTKFRNLTPNWYGLAVYLIISVAIGGFLFANLIIAVIVANLENAVTEMREQQQITDDPLVMGGSINQLDIIPMYDLLAKDDLALKAQRPMKIPTFRRFSLRKLQTYIQLIVALEQNMLETEIITLDFEKVLGVILSTSLQLDIYSNSSIEKEEEEFSKDFRDMQSLEELRDKKQGKDLIDVFETATMVHDFKTRKESLLAEMRGKPKATVPSHVYKKPNAKPSQAQQFANRSGDKGKGKDGDNFVRQSHLF